MHGLLTNKNKGTVKKIIVKKNWAIIEVPLDNYIIIVTENEKYLNDISYRKEKWM